MEAVPISVLFQNFWGKSISKHLIIIGRNLYALTEYVNRRVQEVVFTKEELRASLTIESKGGVSVYWFLHVIPLENKRYGNKIEVGALN
jgi:hypothetical protein